MQTDFDALIRRVRDSDGVAAEELFALLYDELHRLAFDRLLRTPGPLRGRGEAAMVRLYGREAVKGELGWNASNPARVRGSTGIPPKVP